MPRTYPRLGIIALLGRLARQSYQNSSGVQMRRIVDGKPSTELWAAAHSTESNHERSGGENPRLRSPTAGLPATTRERLNVAASPRRDLSRSEKTLTSTRASPDDSVLDTQSQKTVRRCLPWQQDRTGQ